MGSTKRNSVNYTQRDLTKNDGSKLNFSTFDRNTDDIKDCRKIKFETTRPSATGHGVYHDPNCSPIWRRSCLDGHSSIKHLRGTS